MKATDLYRLANRYHACGYGLDWLHDWIACHPNGSASDFFRDQVKVTSECWSVSPHGYLRWAFRHLLDWTDVTGYETLGLHEMSDEPFQEFMEDHWGVNHVSAMKPRDLAEALAKAFE